MTADNKTFQRKPAPWQKKRGNKNHLKKQVATNLSGYWRNISEELDQGISDEQKEAFLKNVFQQLQEEFQEMVTHKNGSFLVQRLIKIADEEQLELLMKSTLKLFDTLMVSTAGSHVLQALLKRCSEYLTDSEDNTFVKMLHQIGMMLLERSDLMTDKCSNHVIRTMIQVMAGVPEEEDSTSAGKKQDDIKVTEHDMYSEFSDLMFAICKNVIPDTPAKLGMLNESKNPHTAFLVQAYLKLVKVKDPAACARTCDTILGAGLFKDTNSDGIPVAFDASCWFCECLLDCVNDEAFETILDDHIVPNADKLVAVNANKRYNHIFQAALKRTTSLEHTQKLIEAVDGKVRQMAQDCPGLLMKLAKVGISEPTLQEVILQIFREGTGSDTAETQNDIIPVLITGSPVGDQDSFSAYRKKFHTVSYFISVAIQHLLNYEDNECVRSSLASLPSACHLALASKLGSFIYTGYIKSPTVPLKHKKQLAESDTLKDIYSSLVKSGSNGSHVFDDFWAVMTVPCKKAVMEILKQSEFTIMANFFSKKVANRIRLKDYIHNNALWQKWFTEENKGKKLATPGKPKKRKTDTDQPMETEKENKPSSDKPVSPKKKKNQKEEAMSVDDETIEDEADATPVKKTPAKKTKAGATPGKKTKATPKATPAKKTKKVTK